MREKLPRSQCDAPVPETLVLPGDDRRVRTDVEEIGEIRLQRHAGKVRPAEPGYSIGHGNASFGTFGCLVTAVAGGSQPFILSNAHVLADSGRASAGDDIYQPAPDDGGTADCVIAELANFVKIRFGAGYPNLVDAAIARVKKPAEVVARIRFLGIPGGTHDSIREGMVVFKRGRTTGLTEGQVRDPEFHCRVPGYPQGTAGFRRQVLCSDFTDKGDSGAVIFTTGRKVIGLHFAACDDGSIFNRIVEVEKALRIRL